MPLILLAVLSAKIVQYHLTVSKQWFYQETSTSLMLLAVGRPVILCCFKFMPRFHHIIIPRPAIWAVTLEAFEDFHCNDFTLPAKWKRIFPKQKDTDGRIHNIFMRGTTKGWREDLSPAPAVETLIFGLNAEEFMHMNIELVLRHCWL